ncbi:MAG: 6,7-dimethyl-8-ribityllumazine synthase [Haloquadratum walsbyi J07HQW2]|jgi:6,7-dimethyl-8-ribityllumazine synthase (EC 2.5.1.9)|uniref:6,7-dimethyl-8-ribityllumazine synthase n=2 Tax=Haloquadratum walsbyi TaxID=293091 RepID=U1PW51_9EURY|nr:MAG: 6,7-dimethyl-8-ribityllumazine synthase [Haloquadratum walsbyi J07HQW2]
MNEHTSTDMETDTATHEDVNSSKEKQQEQTMDKNENDSREKLRAESDIESQITETVNLGLIVADFNRSVTTEMETAAQETAADRDAIVSITLPVPGVYDTPLAADRLARREDIDAVVVLGAIVTGDTNHDQVIGDAVAQKLTDISLERDTPVTFGVSGPGQSGAEARERVGKGAEAVNAAIDMIEVLA